MKRPFISVHVRAFCHETEDLAKVEGAVRSVSGDVELRSKRTEGHHGNHLTVIEGDFTDSAVAEAVLRRLSDDDLRTLVDTAGRRTDESCNFFLRLDKQRACGGEAVLTHSDDAVSVRIKVSAFPAKSETAVATVRAFIAEVMSTRAGTAAV